MPFLTFLRNLKQRKIAQWALAYLAAAWLVVQLVDTLGGRWGFTDSMGRFLDLAAVVGFFVLLVIAWYHGERGHQRVKPTEVLLIAAILVAGGLIIRYADLGDAPDWSDAFADDDRPSVAVLPFSNKTVGGGEDAEFFAAGVHEDILNLISRIKAIRVTSRTSVLSFDEDSGDIAEIAAELGVRNILEGSIRVSGEQIRITLQLIDAENDATLWSNDYQETLTTQNVFAIQGDVARSVAAALETTLTSSDEQQIDKIGTESLEAYQHYLKGREYWYRRTPTSIARAIESFEAAIAADENYAAAYAGLADVYHHLGLANYSVYPPDEIVPKAKDALLRALELDNDIPEAYASLGFVRSWYDRDWERAEQAFRRGIELNPDYSALHQWYAHYLVSQGDFDNAVKHAKRAETVDPRSLITYVVATTVFDAMGDPDSAIAEGEAALELNPNFWIANTTLGHVYGGQSQFDQSVEAAQRGVNDSRRAVYAVATLGWALGRAGRTDEAQALLSELERRSEEQFVSPFNLAMVHIGMGNTEQALDYLERAVPDLMLLYLRSWHLFDPLRDEPRFAEIVNAMNL